MSATAAVPIGVVPLRVVHWLISLMRGRDAAREARRDEDLALVRAVVEEAPGAQERLLRLLLPHIRAVASAVLGREADVDDAVQVATLQVLDDLGSYRGDARLARWARTVAARVCLRLQAKRRRWLRNAELAHEGRPHASTPEYDLPRDVAALLERLPFVQRQAVVLRHVLGHSVAEVAELTGAPVDTVKSRLLFGRRALRSMLAPDGERREPVS